MFKKKKIFKEERDGELQEKTSRFELLESGKICYQQI